MPKRLNYTYRYITSQIIYIKKVYKYLFLFLLDFYRVGGNKKGIFTRDRQPKMAAYHVRKRYYALEMEIDGTPLPHNLENYVSNHYSTHTEL